MRGSGSPTEFRTVREMTGILAVSDEKVYAMLKFAQAQGRLEVRRISSTGIDGRKTTTPAYRILEGK